MSAPNRNFLWAEVVVDELARSGLRAVCIAPGSRSTPLTVAFAEHPQIKVYRHLDERSAAFFALGLAMATETPVAMVCTSGSAVANFYPAVIEASAARIPLLILTGDRPPELRYSGANQTIDQPKIYGEYALWSVDVAMPEGDPAPMLVRSLRTMAARAFRVAGGAGQGAKGVVHLNFPFRKPLEPTLVPADNTVGFDVSNRDIGVAFTRFASAHLHPSVETVQMLSILIATHEQGIIVCGTRCPSGTFAQAVSSLGARIGYPVFAEPSSGVRYGAHVSHITIGGYETFLAGTTLPSPKVVIRFGDVPTSKWLNEYLEKAQPVAYVQVSTDGVWSDDLHQTTHFIHADPVLLCELVSESIPVRVESGWREQIAQLERNTWHSVNRALDELTFDAAYIRDLIAQLPAGTHLFTGNSLAVRHVDQFGQPRASALHLYANRGASGIDGNVSTALGIAVAHPDQPVVMLVGDITLYHDMNGLFALKDQHIGNVTVIVVNNDGGAIFERLPIQGYEPTFTDLFIMPHGLDFRHVAALYEMDYLHITDRGAFREAISQIAVGRKASLIEIQSNGHADEEVRREVVRLVKSQLLMMNEKTD